MEEGKCYVGLEIGSSKVAAVAGLYENKKVKLIGFAERKISPDDEIVKSGNIVNAQLICDRISEVLDSMAAEFENSDFELELNTVNINIANLTIKSTLKSAKIITSGGTNRILQEDVNRLINDAFNSYKVPDGRMVIHMLPSDFYVNDEKTLGTLVGKIGNQLSGDFKFISSKNENLNYLLECINQVPAKGTNTGYLNVESIFLNSVADSFSLLSQNSDSKKDGVAIVNIGAEMTQVCIFHENSLRYEAIIEVAGNIINHDLQKAFSISFNDAELVKKACGRIPSMAYEESPIAVIEKSGGLPNKEIFLKNAITVIEWRLREIAALINVELVKSGLKNSLLNGIILTGGSSMFLNAREIFALVCKINVRNTEFNPAIDFAEFSYLRNPKYSTLLGLVVAPAYNFDKRVDNKILTPKPIVNIKPQAKEENEVEEEKKEGFIKFIGGLFRKPATSLNDDYNNPN